MTLVELGTHAELDPPNDWEQQCSGRIVVSDDKGPMWTIECEQCGWEAGLPARKIDPARHNAQMVDRRRSRSHIPDGLRGVQLPDDGTGPASAAREWAAARLTGLVLTGPVGVGKTHLAAAAAWARLEHGPLRWFSVPVLFAQLGRAFSDEGRHDALDVLVGTDALVLDDLDKTRPTEYAAEQLFCAVDVRVTAGAGLVITTNLPLSALAERFPEPYGEAIVSRLAGYGESFVLQGADRRLERFAA